jgi:integrase
MADKRRSHGEGSVTSRGKNKWRIRYEGHAPSNSMRKQVSETVKGTKAKAQSVLRERIRSLETGQFVQPSQLTVRQYMNDWLKSHAEYVSPKTLENYSSMVKNHIDPIIGQVKLQNLEPHHLSKMFDTMSEKRLSPATRSLCHKTLRKALGDAFKQNLIVSNPSLVVSPPGQRRREPEIWSVPQFNKFMSVASLGEFGNFFEFAALTGMRRSEITGLRWDKVDLDNATLRVAATLQRIVGQGLVVGVPKSRGSRRVIALSVRTVELLKEVRRIQLEQQLVAGSAYESSGYVFTNAMGEPYDSGRASRSFLKVARSADVPLLNLHSLRHLHASVLLANGTHIKVVSERLGHTSVAFTMDVYGHLMPGMQEQAAVTIYQAMMAY